MKKGKLVLSVKDDNITALAIGDMVCIRDFPYGKEYLKRIEPSGLLPPMIALKQKDLDRKLKPSTKLIYSEESNSTTPNFKNRTSYLYITIQENDSMYWDIQSKFTYDELNNFNDFSNNIEKEFKESRIEYLERYMLKKGKEEKEQIDLKNKLLANCPTRIIPLYSLYSADTFEIKYLYRIKMDKDDISPEYGNKLSEDDPITSYGMSSKAFISVTAQQILESPWTKMIAIINYYGWLIPIPMVFILKDEKY